MPICTCWNSWIGAASAVDNLVEANRTPGHAAEITPGLPPERGLALVSFPSANPRAISSAMRRRRSRPLTSRAISSAALGSRRAVALLQDDSRSREARRVTRAPLHHRVVIAERIGGNGLSTAGKLRTRRPNIEECWFSRCPTLVTEQLLKRSDHK